MCCYEGTSVVPNDNISNLKKGRRRCRVRNGTPLSVTHDSSGNTGMFRIVRRHRRGFRKITIGRENYEVDKGSLTTIEGFILTERAKRESKSFKGLESKYQ
jgi:hypothetical protein